MKRVLFVDDEPHVLEGLKRMLHPLRREWEMDFACDGRQALERLSQSEYDVLVTDIRMPRMDGIELLNEVIQRYPQLVRIVLSGTADRELTLHSVLLAHQYLTKPCDAKTLRSTVENAFALVNLLNDASLMRLIGRLKSLPSGPDIYLKLLDALQSEQVSATQIGAIIAQDLGMTAKVLQLANSPLFGSMRFIASPEEAVVVLGVDTVRTLAFGESVFSQFGPKNHPGFSPEELREHSLRVALLARDIAKAIPLASPVVADVFLAGFMHDIGKLVLGCNFPVQYREVVRNFHDSSAVRETEGRLFGTTHAEVGAYLLWLWGLPSSITKLVADHHAADSLSNSKLQAAAVVQLADRLARHGETASDRQQLAALNLPSNFLRFGQGGERLAG